MTGDDPAARLTAHEVVVPGTPEEVWRAIATGPGLAAWMFPADVESGTGGAMTVRREPYGETAHATVTRWDPPHRFGYTEPAGPGGPPLATEFLVRAAGGGSCVVRVVNGFHHDGEGWEDLVEGAGEGWRMSLTVLRAYLTHFAGRPATRVDVLVGLGRPAADRPRAAAALDDLLGITAVPAGASFRTRAGVPELAGTVEDRSPGYVLLRAAEPYPALYAISCFPMAPGAPLSANLLARLYGAPAGAAARAEETWRAWLTAAARTIGT